MATFKELVQKVKKFQMKYSKIRQHQPEWHALMGYTVGGSNLGSLFGVNPYKTVTQLIQNIIDIHHQGAHTLEYPPTCGWGNIFEQVARKYISWWFGCIVDCCNIYIQDEEMPNFRYSPDGIAVV
ncbi:hypothetical protein BC936DRAFT_147141 [Jimgerdemannia flammicorona]|uniref:YqaJ viral recombinase domain-containing protein n=1 Tax=Jimgerdemannia flammicorona TaxID=994334 RepID=A0A433DL88_9FUNG|nr:hypothetical protein BC936DRAFT_147141 [Jimgerdemannia flammicorona]